jgi:hypothetical protein
MIIGAKSMTDNTTKNTKVGSVMGKYADIMRLVFLHIRDSASQRQRKFTFFVKAQPTLCKKSTSRTQSGKPEIAKAKSLLCKGSASRRQRKFIFFVEA